MAVESRYVVLRDGVEVQTFMDKKAADDYDKMLDMADSLAEMFANVPTKLKEEQVEELSIYLAQHREDVLIALQAKKPKPAPKATPTPKATKTAKVAAVTAVAEPEKNIA